MDKVPSLILSPRPLYQRDKFPAEGDHNLDSLPTLAMSAGALGALQVRAGVKWESGGSREGEGAPGVHTLTLFPQLPGVLTRLRADLLSYLRHVQWLRKAGGPSLKTLEPELGALQARLDRLLRRLQLLVRPDIPDPDPAWSRIP